MSKKISKNSAYELVFLISHPSDLNLTIRILNLFDIKNFLILIHNNRFCTKICSHLDNKLINNYKVLKNEIRYGKKNVLKNLYNIYELKYFLSKYKYSKLVIFDKSQLISNIFLGTFKNYLIVSSYSENPKLKNLDLKLSLVTLFYSMMIFLRPVLTFKIAQEANTKTQAIPEYNNLLFWNSANKISSNNKQISFPTKNIKSNNEIIIFGSRFTEWKINNNEQITQEIILYYKNLFLNFPSSKYLYLPHPRESKNEFNILKGIFKESIKLEDDFITAEDFLSNKNENKFCISIASTASKSAYLLGFRSYIFTFKLNFEKDIHQTHKSIHKNLAKEYYIPPQTEAELNDYVLFNSKGDLKNLKYFFEE